MADGENPAAREPGDWTALLPTNLLAIILSLLPLRTAILCGSVSKPWLAAQRELLASAAELDLGREFARRLPMERYGSTVGWVLGLHGAETLASLKIFFKLGSPSELASLKALLELASLKSTRLLELELLVVPVPCTMDRHGIIDRDLRCLMHPWASTGAPHSWASLTRLSLICDARCVPPMIREPLDLPLLQALSIRGFDVTEISAGLFDSCPLLSTVKLVQCDGFIGIKISSPQRLCSLAIIDCNNGQDGIRIDAPALRSLHFHGYAVNIELKDVTSLVDVYIYSTGWQEFMYEEDVGPSEEEDWSFLGDLVHVATLTLCDDSLVNLLKFAEGWLEDSTSRLTFKNLQKLQIIIEEDSSFDLKLVRKILQMCNFPVLENLFIQFAMNMPKNYNEEESELTIPTIMPSKLRLVSLKGFAVLEDQLKMVGFFLTNANALETLAVCVAPHFDGELVTLQMKLEALPKASESVKILLFQDGDDLSHYTVSGFHPQSGSGVAQLYSDDAYNDLECLDALEEEEDKLATLIVAFVSNVDTASASHTVLLDQDMPTPVQHCGLLSFIYNGDEGTFVHMFGMREATFYALVHKLKVRKLLQDTRELSVKEQVALFLCIVGHRSVGDTVRATWKRVIEEFHECFNSVLQAIVPMCRSLIRYRSFQTHHHILENPRYAGFFDDCIGALDGTHIRVLVSPDEARPYWGHHGATQNVLAVVDFSGRFTYVLAGWEGRAHDARVLDDALRHHLHGLVIPRGKYLLGDGAYQLRPGFLTPYRMSPYKLAEWRSNQQPQNAPEMYNLNHNSLRMTVEHAVDILKAKFGILDSPLFSPVKTQAQLVYACCALHNWIIEHERASDLPKPDPQLNAMLANPIHYPVDRARDGPWRQFRNRIAWANWNAHLAGRF